MISEHIFGFFLLTAAPEAPKMRLKYTRYTEVKELQVSPDQRNQV